MYSNSISYITSSVHADRGHEQTFPAERHHPSPLRSSGLVGMSPSLALIVLSGLAVSLPVAYASSGPTLYLPPSPLVVNATSSLGAVVFYNVSATDPDNFSSQLSISCTFPSGSNFPVGTTTVSCQASDPSGNTATGFFEVVVQQT